MIEIFFKFAPVATFSWILVVSGCASSPPNSAIESPIRTSESQEPSPDTGSAPIPSSAGVPPTESGEAIDVVRVGAHVWADDDFRALEGRRVGLITNAAARVGARPLLDEMLVAGVDVVAIFAPEHGFEGTGAAGALIADGIDGESGLRVYSLYGVDRAPTLAALSDVDVLVFDLQDVGVRAYTYLATMGLSMAAAAQAAVPFVVLDRPNPLGGLRLGGWLRASDVQSFVSRYPIPAVHGMTAGELAQAIKGEGWIESVEDVDLQVIAVEGWRRGQQWEATGLTWYPPSPSLPSTDSVRLYPGTVLLEATSVALGRGTDAPFTVAGAPWVDRMALAQAMNERALPGVRFEPTTFTAEASAAVPDPPAVGQELPGVRIVVTDPDALQPVAVGVHLLAELSVQAKVAGVDDPINRPDMLDLLAGTDQLRIGLGEGRSAADLVASWGPELVAFEAVRAPYLLYD